MYLFLHCHGEQKGGRYPAADSLVMQPANHAGRLSRLVDVCVGKFPAVCVKPVLLDSHADLSIAMTKHRADQVHGGTEFFLCPCRARSKL